MNNMKLQFDSVQIKFLLERGILHYVSGEEYMSGSKNDSIEVSPELTLHVKVETLGEITRDKLLRRHSGTSSYTIDEFRVLAHQYKPVYINVVTLIDVDDKTPKPEVKPKTRRGRKPKSDAGME